MPRKERIWTSGFVILWQSQLVSTVGDAVYGIALGFWVLSATGSTALMGALMAASTLPGVLIAPAAGVLIDRADKKCLLILMDFIRAAAVLLLAWSAFAGMLRVWMVFAVGVVLSLCGAVFTPCVQSLVPDIVPYSKLPQANSVFSGANSGSALAGNTAGGFLYQLLGAPILFLINGLSFLFSCLCLPFVRIRQKLKAEKPHFFADIREGARFIGRQPGLRITLIVYALSGFFCAAAFVLFIPLCKFTPGLGSARYGVLMACYTGGALIGYALLSAVTIRAKRRMSVLTAASLLHNGLLAVFANQPYFPVMAAMLLAAGVMNALFSVLILSTVQLSTPQEMRGSVMAFARLLTGGLAPVAMALGGVLGQALKVKYVITALFVLSLAVTVPLYFSRRFRSFISADFTGAPEHAGAENSEESIGSV